MDENTDAQKSLGPEISKPKTFSEILQSVPKEYRQEFGSGNLIIENGIEIKGEGEERKLHITINPEDPEYITYQKDLQEKLPKHIQGKKK